MRVAELCCTMWRMNLRFLLVLCLVATGVAQTTADNTKPAIATPASAGASTTVDPLMEAQAFMNKRQFTEAAAAYQAILGKNPASPEAHTGLLRSLLRGHKLDVADEAAKK